MQALTHAGERAEAREGMREAERFYARALDLVDAESEAALELRLRRAVVLQVLGQAQKALELLETTADEARAAGRLDLTCEALMTLALIDHRQGRPLQRARADGGGAAARRGGRPAEAADQSGSALASVKGDLGRVAEALEDLGRAISIAEEIDDRTLRVTGHLRMGFLLYNMGDLAAAEEQLERCSSLAAELGSSRQQALATFPLALDQVPPRRPRRGRAARRTGARVARAHRRYVLPDPEPRRARAIRARARRRLLAEERLREALPLALAEGNWLAGDIYRYLAEALVRQGRIDDAAELVEFAARGVSAEPPPHLRAAILLAEATVATAKRDADVALERYEEALASSRSSTRRSI